MYRLDPRDAPQGIKLYHPASYASRREQQHEQDNHRGTGGIMADIAWLAPLNHRAEIGKQPTWPGHEARETRVAARHESPAEPNDERGNDRITDVNVRAFSMPQEGEVGDDAARDGPMEDPNERIPHPDPRLSQDRRDSERSGTSFSHGQSTLFWTTEPVTGLK